MKSLALLLCFVGLLAGAETSAPRQPSIVLIMADDLGYGSLGCYGNAEVKTPHIDRLAAVGVRLTDFHSNGAYCSPTRAALLTGRYQQRCAWVPDEELSPVFRAQRKANQKQRWAWGISTHPSYSSPASRLSHRAHRQMASRLRRKISSDEFRLR